MTLETYAAPQNAYVEPRYAEEESFDSNAGNEDPSAALLEASGAYSPPDKSIASSTDTLSFEPPADTASMDTSVSMTVSDGGEQAAAEEPKEREGGFWTTLSTIGEGMVDEVTNHFGRFVGNAVLGVAAGAAIVAGAILVPAVATVATVVAAGAAVVGGVKLISSAGDWLEDGEIIANADQHTAEEVAAARANLIDVGHGTADFMAGAAGGFAGGIRAAMYKGEIEAGGKVIADTVRTSTGQIGKFVEPAVTRVRGAADVVMTKTGTYAGVVGNAVASVSTPVLAQGAKVAGYVSGKVGAVAQPVADRVASATLTVGESVAPYADEAVSLAARGGNKAGQLASKGMDKVTSVAALAADRSPKVILTIADGAQAQATKAMDYTSPYVDQVIQAAARLKDRAMSSASLVLGKASQRADLLAQRIFTERYLASGKRALSDREHVTALGFTRDDDLVVRIADGRVFTLTAPEQGGNPFLATPVVRPWTENSTRRNFAYFSLSAKDPALSSIPQDIVWSSKARTNAAKIYKNA